MRTMKHLALAAMAAGALALAGCGGGGSPKKAGDDGGGDSKVVDLAGLTKGALAAGETKLAAGGTHTTGNLTFTCDSDAGAGGCTLTVKDGTATYTGGTITAAHSAAYKAKLDEDRKTRIAAAKVLGDAIPATLPATALSGFTVNPRAATLVTDTSGDTNTFAMPDDDTAPAIDGWKSSVWTKKNTTGTGAAAVTTTQTLVVYTDIADAGKAAYLTYYNDDGSAPNDHEDWIQAISNVSSGVITFDQNSVTDADSALFGPTFGLTARNQTLTLTKATDDPATDKDDTKASIVGNFHGVLGTFACDHDDGTCTVSSGDTAKFSGFGGTWTFTPTATGDALNDLTVAGVKFDTDYLHFGYWVRDIAGGSTPGKTVDVLFGGTTPAYGTLANAVTGKATYTGKAAGLYARNVLNPDGTTQDSSSGRFTADATLNAAFGGGDIPGNDQFRVSGTISNFMDAVGMAIDANWSLALSENAAAAQGGTVNGATDGGSGTAGQWNGTWYGPSTDNPQPTGIAGEFTGVFSNGRVIGAYGATRPTPTD